MKNILFILVFIFMYESVFAQFAPQAGLLGSEAIYKDSSVIINWASQCTVHKGFLNISDTSLGRVIQGDSTFAIGKSDGFTVSLGDAGEAIYFFENPIMNGPGFDFAVFENGFRDPLDSNNSYAELATIEVSNDGLNYYAFAPICHNDTTIQIAGVGEYMDARKLHNLAGKYISAYGTPFDLYELSMILSLDLENIRYVKIKDVIGTINPEKCSRDMNNQCINDPYPTPFPSGGFDLDALGIIHQKYPTNLTPEISAEQNNFFYPNPCADHLFTTHPNDIISTDIVDLNGKIMFKSNHLQGNSIQTSMLSVGNYIIHAHLKNGHVYQLIHKNE